VKNACFYVDGGDGTPCGTGKVRRNLLVLFNCVQCFGPKMPSDKLIQEVISVLISHRFQIMMI
jgi:hypothetical protein